MDWSGSVLSYLAGVTARSLVLFAVAAVALLAFRVKSAAARHAVWTVVTGGMLLLAAMTPALPPLPLRVLKAVEAGPIPDLPGPVLAGKAAPPGPAPTRVPWTWQDAAVAAYGLGALVLLGRLAFGYLFTRRLLRAATPIPRLPYIYYSGWISVPLTIGRKILLPADWISWSEPKLEAVLAHEHTHVRRADWAIALGASVNRCLFWFHPLAWWLERRLATLAEQACDDSALLLVDSRPYAQALLDMAATVKTSQGRIIWEAMAMAKAAEVRKRIERILDETRQIPRGLTKRWWAAVLLCSAPVVWLASVAQLTPAIAQEQPRTPVAMGDYLKSHRQLGSGDVAVVEQYLVTNPHDVDARTQLILFYYANGVREPRISHILWLIANHPESSAAVFTSQGILARDNSMNTSTDYQRALGLWKQAISTHQGDGPVLANAARFLQYAGQFEEAERLLVSIGAGNNGPGMWLDQLSKLYAAAILGATGDPKFPNPEPSFANRVRSELESSENGFLLFTVGSALRAVAQRPQPGQTLPSGILNLDDHPQLNAAVELGDRLMARASQKSAFPAVMPPGVNGGVVGGVPGGVRGGVIGGVIGASPAATPQPATAPLVEAPPVSKRVDPVYPPLALQARISGIVKFQATIGTDGTVRNLQVSSGHPLLVPAAMEAVRQWTFQPPSTEIRTALEIPFLIPPGSLPQPGGLLMDKAGKASAAPPPGGLLIYQDFGNGSPAPPKIIKVGSNVQASRIIRHVDPIYPPQARAERIEGSVTLQVTIGEDGQVQNAEPTDGNPILAAAAQAAVKQWAYQPTLLNGQPVSIITTVIVPFQLN